MPHPPVIDLVGDRNICKQFISYGRSLLGRVQAKKSLNGVTQDRLWGYPTPGVAVMAENNGGHSRILIRAGQKAKRFFKKIIKWYWYHIVVSGYRWYINDMCIDRTGMIYIVGGNAVTNPAIWYGDYAVIVQYTPEGHPVYVKRWDKLPVTTEPAHGSFIEDTHWCFAVACCAGEVGYIYALVDWAYDNVNGVYENMLVKIASNGSISWDIGVGNTDDDTQVYGIEVQYYEDPLEIQSFVAAAYEVIDFDVGLGGDSYRFLVVAAFTASGSNLWKRAVRFPFTDTVADGTIDWKIEVTDLKIDSSGNVYALYQAHTPGAAPGSNLHGEATITKWNSSGTVQWSKKYQSNPEVPVTHEYSAYEMDIHGSNIYITYVDNNLTTNELQYILLCVSTSGTINWATSYFTADWSTMGSIDLGFDVWARVAVDRNGNCIVLSQAFDSSVSDDDDYLLGSISPDGDLNWIEMMHGTEWGVNFGGMGVDKANDIVIAGDVYSQDRSFTIKLPNGPIAGTFHNFDFSAVVTSTSTYSMQTSSASASMIEENATDIDIRSVDYITSLMDTDTKTLYKFLEEQRTEEVYHG